MAENEKIVLSDKSMIPTDDYIFSIIGERKVYWVTIMKYLSANNGCSNLYIKRKQFFGQVC